MVVVQWDENNPDMVAQLTRTARAHLDGLSVAITSFHGGACPDEDQNALEVLSARMMPSAVPPLGFLWIYPQSQNLVLIVPEDDFRKPVESAFSKPMKPPAGSWPTQFDAALTSISCILETRISGLESSDDTDPDKGATGDAPPPLRQDTDTESPFPEFRPKRKTLEIPRNAYIQPSATFGYGVSVYNGTGGTQDGFTVETGLRFTRYFRFDLGADILLSSIVKDAVDLGLMRVPLRLHVGGQLQKDQFLFIISTGLVVQIANVALLPSGNIQTYTTPGWMTRLFVGYDSGHRMTFYVAGTFDLLQSDLNFTYDGETIMELAQFQFSASAGIMFRFR